MPPSSHPCPGCGARGLLHSWACCRRGQVGRGDCCGDPDVVEVACPWCDGEGSMAPERLLAYAEATGDMAAYAEHEASLMLGSLALPSGSKLCESRKKRPL